jgi:hypothetical protein
MPKSADVTNSDFGQSTPHTVIGWRENIELPEWGIESVQAKIDTGARTSALHVREIEELDDGKLRFEVVLREKPTRQSVWAEAQAVRDSNVKPSSGERQRRRVVKTLMKIGPIERRIEISLVCRKGMLCRMLVGRTALENLFIVDPSAKYLVSKTERKPQSGQRGDT